MVISIPIIIILSIILTVGLGGVIVYEYVIKTSDSTTPVIPVEPPVNQPPILEVDTPVKCIVNLDCSVTIEEVSDPDGNITNIIWNQESGPQVNFIVSEGSLSAVFLPVENGSYIFSVEAIDNNGSSVLKSIVVNVGVNEPLECVGGTHEENGVCISDPTPTPVTKDIKITIVGDVYDGNSGNAVFQQIKKQNATYDFVLGDLGYQSTLKWFKSTYGSLGDKMWCVIGNHEAANEDGSASLEKEALDFCGNSYWIKNGVNLFLMFNTNDDQNVLKTAVGKVLDNSTIINGVKNIHINGHKGCVTPPNSHQPAGEIKTLCDYLKSKIPSNIKVWYNSAHNHIYSESADKTYKQSGAGGKSHYTCGTNSEFPYCNNSNYGFLLYIIKPDGNTTSSFIDYNGDIIK